MYVPSYPIIIKSVDVNVVVYGYEPLTEIYKPPPG
jgi:hypothetical protein